MIDYYAVLGVDKTATLEQIRSAYHQLALKHHPDRNKGSEESEDRFREIAGAYNVLSDERQRKRYDHERARPAPRVTPAGQYNAPPPADMEDPRRPKYEAVRNSYFYQHGERRRAQNQQQSFRPHYGISDPLAEPGSTGLVAPIELGKSIPIVGKPPVLGENVQVVQGGFGALPGFFWFKKKT